MVTQVAAGVDGRAPPPSSSKALTPGHVRSRVGYWWAPPLRAPVEALHAVLHAISNTISHIGPYRPIATALRLPAVIAVAWALAAPAGAVDGGAGPSSEARHLDVVFVLDNSGSMRDHDPGRATHAIVARFAREMPRGGRLGVVLFDDSARLVQPLTREVGPGASGRWEDVLAGLDYGGQRTNSPAGIERALYELAHAGRGDGRKAILFVTDGIVDTGDPARDVEKTRWLKDELVVEARRTDVRIFGVALTEAADVELIQALALGTGGDYWRVDEARDIGGLLAEVRERLAAAPAAPPVPAPSAGDGPPAVASRTATGPSAEPRSSALPPIAASRADDGGGGLLLLSLGLGVAAALLAYPALARAVRARRGVPVRPPAYADLAPGGGSARDAALLPALPRGGRPPVVKLVDLGGATGRGEAVLLLEKATTRIGRDPASEVAIDDDTVSSFHATLDWRDGYFHVEDQRSTNGTFLNGERLDACRPVRLKSGDCVRVATHDFRFLVPDHEPSGRTAVLAGTSVPQSGSTGADVAAGGPAGGPDPEPVAALVAAFDRCLGAHLDRTARLGPAHRRFVERAFPVEARALLARRAQALVERGQVDGQGEQTDFSRAGIHFTLCVVPDTLAGARRWYTERSGGYAKFLVGLLDGRAQREPACDAVCVVTFGLRPEPWISLTIVPARDDADAVEVMSLEFLSEDERREARALDIADVGGRA